MDQITALKQREESERSSNNFVKSLELCIKILNIYLNENEYMALFEAMKELSLIPCQSFLSIFGILRYSIKVIYPKISRLPELMAIYLSAIHVILENIAFSEEKHQQNLNLLLKMIKEKPINVKRLFDAINSFEYDEGEQNKGRDIKSCFSNLSKDTNGTKEPLSNGVNLSNSTTHINIQLKNDSLSFTKQTIKLPSILFILEITLSKSQLKQTLIDNMLILNTQLKDNASESEFTVTQKDNNLIRSICHFMFPTSNEVNKIKCLIKSSSNRYDRLVELKGLTGLPNSLEALMATFIKRLIKIAKNIQIIRHTDNYFPLLRGDIKKGFEAQKKEVYNPFGLYDENCSIIESINKEAANYYEIYRIISQENYDLGKSVSEFITQFKEKHRSVDKAKADVPHQMKEILALTESCVGTFNSYFNFGKANTEKLLKCCRPAVEKFVFNKLYYLLYSIYEARYAEENIVFLAKQSLIRKRKLNDVMAYLEIKPKYRCLDDYKDAMVLSCLPYKSTIDCVNKMEYEQCPKDKFDTLISAGLDLRNTILGLNAGQMDLSSMDDELPIFIYITTQLNVKNLFAELHMADDYLKYSISEDKESKVLTNLMSAMFFISNGWNMKEEEEH